MKKAPHKAGKSARKKVTTVHEHSRRIPVSKKNPTGVTVIDQHLRRLPGTSLDATEIDKLTQSYNRKKLAYPTAGKLRRYRNADQYDDVIAIWVDYFNNKFREDERLDPDVIKALIAGESGFRIDPKENRTALGIAQITRPTLKLLQDPTGEAKDFIFTEMRLKDLKNPAIAIPLASRWLFRKKTTAKSKLGREPTHEEIILEYKGLLRSSSALKTKALKIYRKHYAELKSRNS